VDISVDVRNMNKAACCMSVMHFWKHMYARIFYRNKIFYGRSIFSMYCQSFPILIIHFLIMLYECSAVCFSPSHSKV